LKNVCNWQGIGCKLSDDDIKVSKHVAVYLILDIPMCYSNSIK